MRVIFNTLHWDIHDNPIKKGISFQVDLISPNNVKGKHVKMSLKKSFLLCPLLFSSLSMSYSMTTVLEKITEQNIDCKTSSGCFLCAVVRQEIFISYTI